MLLTQRLAMTPMSCEVMRAIMAADWQRADGLLGTPFPIEWHNDGWEWLAPRVVEGDHDARLLDWGTRLVRLTDGLGPVVAEVGFHGPPVGDGWVEIGYRVVTDYRRRGFAEERAAACSTGLSPRVWPGCRSDSPRRTRPLCGWPRNSASPPVRHEVLGEQLIFERPRLS